MAPLMNFDEEQHPEVHARVSRKAKGASITAGLTCLQFGFAIYATFLLYYIKPTLDPVKSSLMPWTSHFSKPWNDFLEHPSSQTESEVHEHVLSVDNVPLSIDDLCVSENLNFSQKTDDDPQLNKMKHELFQEILKFQQQTNGCETLPELLELPSSSTRSVSYNPKVLVILNHFKRRTLCAQLDALMAQTLPFHTLWVLAFDTPDETRLRNTVEAYNDTRIHFVSSTYNFKYYGRFQMALQADGIDFVYILDDDMIPGKKVLRIMAHAAGTAKYHNGIFGHIGRILPFRQKDFSFPSYRKQGSKEAGLYLPDPAYKIIVDRVMQVDFLSSGWFLAADLVKTLFIEKPATFFTGEDLHLSYQMQKYRDGNSYILPIDPNDKETWGDSEHRLAYVSETTVIYNNIVQMRDDQWWSAMSRGYVTQWARMYPQQSDVLFYAHSLKDVMELAPLLLRFKNTPTRKAYLVVTGGPFCPCEEAASLLGWQPSSCYERRFKIFDLQIKSLSTKQINTALFHEVYSAMKGLIKIHSPALIISVDTLIQDVRRALALAAFDGNISLIQLPSYSIEHSLWIPEVKTQILRNWNKMRITVNIITQNRPASLKRLLKSLSSAYYLGDVIPLTFNMDREVDMETLAIVNQFQWPHGQKTIRRRIIQGGLIRAVSESWYPSSDDDFGLLLEDDIEVSPFYYIWLKYTLLVYHYNPQVSFPELNAIALYTPRVIEVVAERPRWNATHAFQRIHPNTPYLHQLPCSWGSLFFPKHWREFYHYMGTRYTENAKENPVQIPHSRTNGWQASWKKFLIDMMYLRGYVTLYPNFPNHTSFSTNHLEPGAHINATDNVISHKREDFEVPLIREQFWKLLPEQKLPAAARLPVINLFNQPSSIKGLRSAGARLRQDVLSCNDTQIVVADEATGQPIKCASI